ncbi:hypothetical protein HK405_005750, partial [Cladochytrium tenue]
HRNHTVARIRQFMATPREEGGRSTDLFDKYSLGAQLTRAHASGGGVVELEAYAVPDLRRIPFDEAITAPYKPAHIGMRLGPS